MMRSPSRMRRPASSSTSRTALSTPRVTSSNGASTVVGASPRTMSRYTPSRGSIRMALVVVEPQSVARIERIAAGSRGRGSMVPRSALPAAVAAPLGEPPRALRFGARLDPGDEGFHHLAPLDQGGEAAVVAEPEQRLQHRLEEDERLAGDHREGLGRLQRQDRRDLQVE